MTDNRTVGDLHRGDFTSFWGVASQSSDGGGFDSSLYNIMHKHQPHEWHENRTKEEGGGKIYKRARWDWRDWKFSFLVPEVERWQPIENPGIPEFLELRDVLFRKYQRKRVPFKFVEQVDQILKDLGYVPEVEEEVKEEGEEEEW